MFRPASRFPHLCFAALVLVPLLAACENTRPVVPNNGGGGAGGSGATTSAATTSSSTTAATGTGGAPDAGP